MKNINDLRTAMFDTIEQLKKGKIDIETAKAVASVGQVVIESAKLEVEYIRAIGVGSSEFLTAEGVPQIERCNSGGTVTKIGNKTIHRG